MMEKPSLLSAPMATASASSAPPSTHRAERAGNQKNYDSNFTGGTKRGGAGHTGDDSPEWTAKGPVSNVARGLVSGGWSVVGGRAKDHTAASTSQMSRFETETFTQPHNLKVLMN